MSIKISPCARNDSVLCGFDSSGLGLFLAKRRFVLKSHLTQTPPQDSHGKDPPLKTHVRTRAVLAPRSGRLHRERLGGSRWRNRQRTGQQSLSVPENHIAHPPTEHPAATR